ncbi:MAG: alkaline phosphatase family protein [Gemmatimonadaceae bacterium]|nr:alkaline phosphatase family protein [Gemmatimonadaceae bacterium]
MTAVILVADGVRPDTLAAAIDAGQLPALAALRRDGASHVVTSVFPSVTGPAYVPFLMGLHPGEAGIPGIRWWDRAGTRAYAHGNARSYVGFEALRQDGDLTIAHPTLFELAERPLAALTPIGRGLRDDARLGAGIASWPRMAWTHFRGDTRGWLRLEAALADRVAARAATGAHDLVLFAHQCIDKFSHLRGHDAPEVLAAMRGVDDMVARLRDDAARAGRPLDLLVVSDHGHSPVHAHLDLADLVRARGHGVLAHPWTFAGGDDVAVMVSGNAMAHLYLELGRRERPWWPVLGRQWGSLVAELEAHPAVDLLLLPHGPDSCEVRSATRGAAFVRRTRRGGLRYEPTDGDPLELASALDASGTLGGEAGLDADAAYDASRGTTYPDALTQVLALAGSQRAGEIIVSAAPGWDLRSRWEPIPHRSTHGSLRREHLLVPLLTTLVPDRVPRRTADVFRLARQAMATTRA